MKRFILLAALLPTIVPATARADAAAEFQQAQSAQKCEQAEYYDQAPELDKSHPCRTIAASSQASRMPASTRCYTHTNGTP
jgi:type II secretory pathway pseudopilin PulG